MKHKNPKVAVFSIQLLEALIKNCPHIHASIANEEFMQTLVKLTRRKNEKSSFLNRLNPSVISNYEESERIDKTLMLIQSLGQSFRNSSTYPIFRNFYEKLLRQGVRFPVPLKDEGAPIFTPPPTHVLQNDMKLELNYSDSLFKTYHDNAMLLQEMLDNSDPNEDLKKNEIITSLVLECRNKHGECVKSLNSNISEKQTNDILALNDILIDVVAKYDNLVSGKVLRTVPVENKVDKDEEIRTEKSQESDDDYDEDLLGLGPSLEIISKSNVKNSTFKNFTKKESKKEPEFNFPAIEPPKNISDREFPSMKHKTQFVDDLICDFNDISFSNEKTKPKEDFFSFTDSPFAASDANNDNLKIINEDDHDDFFEIASRHRKSADRPQSFQLSENDNQRFESNPFDDDFFSSSPSIHSNNILQNENGQSVHKNNDAIDPFH